MNYNEIILKDNSGEEVVLKFRMTSGSSIELEEKMKKPMMAYLQDESITMVVTMLRYMRMWEEKNIGMQKAQEIYDLLVDNGWTYKRILQDIIYETLVKSGFLEAQEWEQIKAQTEAITKRLMEEVETISKTK